MSTSELADFLTVFHLLPVLCYTLWQEKLTRWPFAFRIDEIRQGCIPLDALPEALRVLRFPRLAGASLITLLLLLPIRLHLACVRNGKYEVSHACEAWVHRAG